MSELKRVSIEVTGIVQGVGFRPTVYRYANQLNLSGFVMNTLKGVSIELEGDLTKIKEFIEILQKNPPRLAKIKTFTVTGIDLKYQSGFSILSSYQSGLKDSEISPDLAVCKDCISDIFDKGNRRYLYPFTNCTNCGPRFSIIKDRPYDRAKTSMSEFKMCADCEAEYNDPSNRRFHAQPNACSICGPRLKFIGSSSFDEFISSLKNGSITAIKGIGGFNIACDAFNKATLSKLRKLKQRPSKSFAVMMKNLEVVKKFCIVSKKEEEILISPQAPIVLLRKRNKELNHISPDNNYYGVMLPYTPLHHLIFKHFDVLIMTSANKLDEPIAVNDEEIQKLLSDSFIDNALSNDREIINRSDDSIVSVVKEKTMMVRRSRGYVPEVINIDDTTKVKKLSLGADLKNTFSIRKDFRVYLSQHIGDLEELRNFDFQKQEIDKISNLMEFSSETINTDAHPLYQNNDKRYQKIYHHHAHALSVMAEHKLLGKKVFAVIADGTGFGTDNNVWGFEFLGIDENYKEFKRLAHLKYFMLPGGEKSITEIARIAFALAPNKASIKYPDNINCSKTSSLGRLFDGVAYICGLLEKAEYEAHAAILLQREAELFDGKLKNSYKVVWQDNLLDYQPMIDELISDIQSGISIKEVSYKFHTWVVDAIIEAINRYSKNDVLVFSGGCFQNILLCNLLIDKLFSLNKEYYFNELVPANDGGISLGQAVI